MNFPSCRALCVRNDTGICPWQPTGPHQFSVNASPRQLWSRARLETAKAHHQVFSPHTGLLVPLQLLSQFQMWAGEFSVIFLRGLCEGNVLLPRPPACVCLLWQENCFLFLSSLLSSLIQNVLSCWLLLVLRGTKHKRGLMETSGGCVRLLEESRGTVLCILKSILPVLLSSCITLCQSRKENLYK